VLAPKLIASISW